MKNDSFSPRKKKNTYLSSIKYASASIFITIVKYNHINLKDNYEKDFKGLNWCIFTTWYKRLCRSNTKQSNIQC